MIKNPITIIKESYIKAYTKILIISSRENTLKIKQYLNFLESVKKTISLEIRDLHNRQKIILTKEEPASQNDDNDPAFLKNK